MASEYFKALKHRMETKLNIASDDRIPKQIEEQKLELVS